MRVLEQTATVDYQIATYEGTVDVMCDENDDEDFIIAKAKRIVTRSSGGSLPYGYESWNISSRN